MAHFIYLNETAQKPVPFPIYWSINDLNCTV